MIYRTDIDYKVWAAKHGLNIDKKDCPYCDVEMVTDVPFITKQGPGLISAEHGCGPNSRIAVCKFNPEGIL